MGPQGQGWALGSFQQQHFISFVEAVKQCGLGMAAPYNKSKVRTWIK